MSLSSRPLKAALWLGMTALVAGCALSPTTLLNPEFLNVLTPNNTPASLPGEAPALRVTADNQTSRPVSFAISYRGQSDVVNLLTFNVDPQQQTSRALVCPITEITLGDVSNLDRVGAIVRLGGGTDADPFIQVEPFGVLLKEHVNYECGDAITFVVRPSGSTQSGFQTFAFFNHAQQ